MIGVPDPTTMARESRLELALYAQLEQACLPLPAWQVEIAGHKWDFAYPEPWMILVEVQGGTRGLGRHSREPGYSQDRARANQAQLDGWLVLEFTAGMINAGSALETVRRALEVRK